MLTILTRIKTCKRGTENLNKVSHAPEVLVHVPEVCVDVVTIP